jgi:DUF4097 and DUF4098 domain-containing protein YvlB
MSLRTALTVVTLSLAVATASAADATFERTLNTGSSPSVSVATGSGNIHLHPGSENQVHIVAHLHSSHGWMSGDVDSRIQQIVNNPPIAQSGNEITIGAENHDNDLYRNISIDYDITLPRASALAAATGSGDIHIENVGASLKAQSGSGNVQADGIQGSAILGTGSGNIDFQQTSPGDVKAETGSGNIVLHGVAGALKSSTGSGDLTVEGRPTTGWKLETGSGNIHLAVGNAHFNLDADTGSGSIDIAQPITMQGSLNRHHINGSVNGGGPIVRASTGSGDIQIKN